MIEINLLPGARRKARRGGGSKVDVAASIAAMRERIREPWLIGAAAVTVVALVAVGALYFQQSKRETALEDSLQKAVQDSTRYSSVLREHDKAEARRDTVLRSLNLIRAIDDDRFIWPHVMDEVSRALPPYTWIVSLGFSGVGQAQAPVSTVAAAPAADSGAPAGGRKKRRAISTLIARDTVRVRLVGNTVDIQSLTRFIRQLEASPFLEQIQLAKSERANDNGKEITQFQLDMLYSRPDPAMMKRVPLAVSVR
ncbi:MAG: PilN domain-containing protein [Gemmatimonadaceae bacterium]